MALGLTQAEAALRLGLDERTVRRFETGEAEPGAWYDFALDGLASQLWWEHIQRIARLLRLRSVELERLRLEGKAKRLRRLQNRWKGKGAHATPL